MAQFLKAILPIFRHQYAPNLDKEPGIDRVACICPNLRSSRTYASSAFVGTKGAVVIAVYLDKLRRKLDKRHRESALRYLRSKDARVYKRIDGIALVQYPDHIATTLLQGNLWRFKDFETVLAILRPFIKKGAFIDFGANSGMHSVYAARTNLFTKIVAIEPLEANFELLCANLRLNSVENAMPLQFAVSDRDGQLSLPIERARLARSTFAREGHEFELVQTRRLDSLLDEFGIDASSISLIWMSVRGHEKQALDGMTRVLAGRVPLSIHFAPQSEADTAINLLKSHYQHCTWEGCNSSQPISALNPEFVRGKNFWIAVW